MPADLDTKPYRDEHDFDLLRRMMAAVEKGHLLSTRSKTAVRNAIEKVMHHSRFIAAKRPSQPGSEGANGPSRGVWANPD